LTPVEQSSTSNRLFFSERQLMNLLALETSNESELTRKPAPVHSIAVRVFKNVESNTVSNTKASLFRL
jgi:hypothetical protein